MRASILLPLFALSVSAAPLNLYVPLRHKPSSPTTNTNAHAQPTVNASPLSTNSSPPPPPPPRTSPSFSFKDINIPIDAHIDIGDTSILAPVIVDLKVDELDRFLPKRALLGLGPLDQTVDVGDKASLLLASVGIDLDLDDDLALRASTPSPILPRTPGELGKTLDPTLLGVDTTVSGLGLPVLLPALVGVQGTVDVLKREPGSLGTILDPTLKGVEVTVAGVGLGVLVPTLEGVKGTVDVL